MSECKMTRLGDVCSFQGGVNIDRSLLNEDGTEGVPVILHSDIEKGQVSTYYTGEYTQEQLVRRGEYLVSLTDRLSIEAWSGEEALYSHHFCRLCPDTAELNPLYMAYALSYIFSRLEDNENIGVLEDGVSIDDLAETVIPLPGLTEQERIANVLHSACDLSELQFDQLDKSEELLNDRFVELFGEIEVNDRGWETKPLGALTERLKSRSLLAKDRVSGEYPYYDSTGVVDYVDEYLFDEDLLLVAKVGSVLTSGEIPIAKAVHGKIWASDLVHVLRINPDAGVIPEYLEMVINSIDIAPSLRGGVMPKLTKASLNELIIPVPPMELQLEYKGFLGTIVEQCEKTAQRIAETDQICHSLNQRYFESAMSYE
ncbi:MAG: restriction endonuclease subunit S [Candidatus Bruticola sp.]